MFTKTIRTSQNILIGSTKVACGEANCDWTEHRLDCLFRPYMYLMSIGKFAMPVSNSTVDVMWWMETFDLDGGQMDAVKHVDDLAITNLAVRINERFENCGDGLLPER